MRKQTETAAQQAQRGRDLAPPKVLGRDLHLLAGELQPELRRLVRALEEELVVVRPLCRRLLEGEQLVGAEVTLVVACARLPEGRAGTRPRAPFAPVSARAEHTFERERPVLGRGGPAASGHRAARAPPAAAHARRARRPGAHARRGLGTAPGDRRGPGRVGDLLRAARDRQDDARPDHRRDDRSGLRGALRGLGLGERRPRRDRASARAPRCPGTADDPLPGRDPPLQQGPARRAAAGGRGGARHADRGDDGEPVLRGQLGAALPRPALRAAAADRGGARHRRPPRGSDARGRARAGRCAR